jgi:CBS domain containing-hemolysin-like protein
MALLLFWCLSAIVLSHFCSLLEVTLLTVRPSALLERQAAGSRGAGLLFEIKQHRIDDAISAVLVLNTLAITVGATLAGAQAARLFGEAGVGLVSAVLTALLLVVSEIVPKTLAARYAGKLSGFTGHGLWHLVRVMAPLLVVTRTVIHLLARQPRERLTRRQFAMLVDTAPEEGAISLAEAALIGSLIYSREVRLKEIMTPWAVVFQMALGQTVADLIAKPGADAFSRIPLFDGDRRQVRGYLSHREVLKAYALDGDRSRPLSAFLRPIPTFAEDETAASAFEGILAHRESVALVTGASGEAVGLVSLEDILEALLGLEITDEPQTVAHLRPAVAQSRRRRNEALRRKRNAQTAPGAGWAATGGAGPDPSAGPAAGGRARAGAAPGGHAGGESETEP